MDKYEYENVTMTIEEDESDCSSKVGVRGKLRFDVKYFYNYENYFVDAICQRNPHYLYFETCIFIILLHWLFYYF